MVFKQKKIKVCPKWGGGGFATWDSGPNMGVFLYEPSLIAIDYYFYATNRTQVHIC